MTRRDHRDPCFSVRNDRSADTFDNLTARKNREALQLLKAAEVVFPVTLRFLLRGKTIRFLRGVFNGYSEGDVPVNGGHCVRYILAEDAAGISPEGTLTLRGHFNSCLLLLEAWDYDYFRPDQFWNQYYGGASYLCIKIRHLVHERTVGLLIGARGQQVDHLSQSHDCDIHVLGLTLPKSTERVACIVGRIPDTVRVIRDMFLTLLAKPNELNNLVIYYHPSSYNFEISKRGGGVFECQTSERQRLIASKGPQHRRRSKGEARTSRSTHAVNNTHAVRPVPCAPPPVNPDPRIAHFVANREQQRPCTGPWSSVPSLPRVNTIMLPPFPQFFHPWYQQSIQFPHMPQFHMPSGPFFQYDLRPVDSQTSAVPLNSPYNCNNSPLSHHAFGNYRVPHFHPQQAPQPAPTHGSVQDSNALEPADSHQYRDSFAGSPLRLKAIVIQIRVKEHSTLKTLPITEKAWFEHQAFLTSLHITGSSPAAYTCAVESSLACSDEAWASIGDIKEWFFSFAQLREAAKLEEALDWVSRRSKEAFSSAEFWTRLGKPVTAKPSPENEQTPKKTTVDPEVQVATSSPQTFNVIISPSDTSTSSNRSDSAAGSSIAETAPIAQPMQRRRASTYRAEVPPQVKRPPNVPLRNDTPPPSSDRQRAHLHAMAQRTLASSENKHHLRNVTTSYLDCTPSFFKLDPPTITTTKLTVVELLVDHYTAGGIIGAGGESINQIRRISQCVIFIQPQTWIGERRRIILSGWRKSVESALDRIGKDLRARFEQTQLENPNRPVFVQFTEHGSAMPLRAVPEPPVSETSAVGPEPAQKYSDDSGLQSEDSARSQEEDNGDWVEVSHKKFSTKKMAAARAAAAAIAKNSQPQKSVDPTISSRKAPVNCVVSTGYRCRNARTTAVGARAQRVVS